jgi:hypothetical protein
MAIYVTNSMRPWQRYCATMSIRPRSINGAEDHVHVLVRLSRKFPVMKIVQESKVETSKWLKRQATIADDFSWQAGYGAFSVSASALEAVKEYIRNQQEHHRRMSFQDTRRSPPGANFVADTVWNWMKDMLGIRTVPLGLNGNGGLYPQGNDKARGTRLVGAPILSLIPSKSTAYGRATLIGFAGPARIYVAADQ